MQLLLDLLAQVGLGDPLVVEDRAQLLDDELVHLLAQVFERLRALVDTGAGAAGTPSTASVWAAA